MLKSFLRYCLRMLAKKIIKKYQPDVVGITGSVGKTSTKEAVAAVLSRKFNVRKTPKNYNNEIGVPLTIIGAPCSPGRSVWGWLKVFARGLNLLFIKDKHYPEILVLEMGADRPGDIKYLTTVAPCKVGVWTTVAHAHTEYFKTLNKIVLEKRVIITHLSSDGFAVLNFDDPLIMENKDKTRAEVITYGFGEGAQLRGSDVNFIIDEATGWPTGLNFKVTHAGNVVPVFLPGAAARPLIGAALAGLSVGSVFGVNLVEGALGLKELRPLAGHMRLLLGIKNTLIIDDTYNSSPLSAQAALESLSRVKVAEGARRYAVLGDMLELGPETENAHRALGRKVAEAGVDFLITVGEAAKLIAVGAGDAGLDENRIAKFSDAVSAGKFLQEKMKTGDAVLIKGSQGMRLEKAVKEVMAEPLRAGEFLVRQGLEWA